MNTTQNFISTIRGQKYIMVYILDFLVDKLNYVIQEDYAENDVRKTILKHRRDGEIKIRSYMYLNSIMEKIRCIEICYKRYFTIEEKHIFYIKD
jgi:hypothetical protein